MRPIMEHTHSDDEDDSSDSLESSSEDGPGADELKVSGFISLPYKYTWHS